MNEINVDEPLLKPMKIIYKYKNENKKIQNLLYIYVGKEGLEYESIFKKIKKLNLFDTFMSLTSKEIKKLEQGFGKTWFACFFNTYHISFILDKIKTDVKLKKKFLEKYDVEWLKNIINIFKLNIINKKSNYSYNEFLNREYQEQMGKKLTKIEIDEFYKLNLKTLVKTDNILYKQLGGDEEENIENDENDENFENEINENYEMDEIIFDDIENVSDLYETIKITKNIDKTNKEISKIFNEKTFKSKKKNMIKFDDKNDNSYENQNLEYCYDKEFVYNQYLFMDDTIENIKNKITSSILNNEKFGQINYLIPSRIYLWTEYIIHDKIDQIMLGHTFSKNNELLNIDIEPLSLYNYENLENKVEELLKTLKNYGKKIVYTNKENKIINEYKNFMMNNEIYMIDIYNELGVNYSSSNEKKKNLIDTFFKIYFPKITSEEIYNIFDYLNKKNSKEEKYIEDIFETLYNNILLENEVTELIEDVRIEENNIYKNLFKTPNNILMTNMKCFLKISDEILEKTNLENINKVNENTGENVKIILPRLNLFRIFNDFKTNETYPFIQYNIAGSDRVIKYDENFMINSMKSNETMKIIQKWFSAETQAVSFKVKINERKFMNINLNEIGILEYKIIWSESDNSTVYDLKDAHSYIINLIKILNKNFEEHQNKVYINIPTKNDFKFNFLNTIQRYSFPNNETINYDDLKEFSKQFYPYISLIVNSDKTGVYLEFKRISNYVVKSSIENRILDFMRYKKYNEEDLIIELNKLFNLTREKAKQEIEQIKTSHSKKISNLKQTDELKKYKNPGTRIDLQGKNSENYLIKISGTKDINEMNRILTFMNSFLYLYYEIYINKNKSLNKINKKLKELTLIADKRVLTNKVYEVVEKKNEYKKIKEIDQERLDFKPEEGFSNYSRLCQNSGEKNKRRPKIVAEKNIDQLKKDGYKFNSKTGNYEKNVISRKEGKITVQTIKLKSFNETTGKYDNIYYTCNPKNNNDNTYIGFLTKSSTPSGVCLPCCFKSNPFKTEDQEKINFYKKCLNENMDNTNSIKPISSADILYILQDTNKIFENRIAYLPKFLNYFFNNKFDNTIETKHFYLKKTNESGYYFKYGIEQNNYSFINTLTVILNMTQDEIKNHIIEFFKKDKNELYYMSLNQGLISSKYRQHDFMSYLKENNEISFDDLKDILKIKGLFTKNGIYPLVFKKIEMIEENKNTEEFYLDLDDNLMDDEKYNIDLIQKMDLLILIKDGKYYYPVVNIKKIDKKLNDITIEKFIENEKIKELIIQFIKFTMEDININIINETKTLKQTYLILNDFINEKIISNDYEIKFQVVDNQYKCRYAILNNNLFIPVKPSGIIPTIPVVCFGSNLDGCFSYSKFLSLDKMIELTNYLYQKTNKLINIKILSVFFDVQKENDIYCLGVITSNDNMIPIEPSYIKKDYLKKNNLSYKNVPLEYEIDKKLLNFDNKKNKVIDKRIEFVNQEKYDAESYQLFRFEFSYYINLISNEENKNDLIQLVENKNKKEVVEKIYSICKKNKNSFINIINEIPNLNNYIINNQRLLCKNLDKNDCNENKHCNYKNDKCFFSLTENKLNEYIQKMTSEIIENKTKFMEIFQKNSYVSDIVNYNYYNEYVNEKIIKINDINILSTLNNVFGNKKLSRNKKKNIKSMEKKIFDLQNENPLKDVKYSFIQNIIPNNYTILRAYVNGYYWIKHSLYEPEDKNLKYYSYNQNEYLNLFISFIIDWVIDVKNHKILNDLENDDKKILLESININNDLQNELNLFIVNIIQNYKLKNYSIFELFILNKIHKIPIVLLFDGVVKLVIDNKIKKTNNIQYLNKNNICINLENIVNKNPQIVEVIYYKS